MCLQFQLICIPLGLLPYNQTVGDIGDVMNDGCYLGWVTPALAGIAMCNVNSYVRKLKNTLYDVKYKNWLFKIKALIQTPRSFYVWRYCAAVLNLDPEGLTHLPLVPLICISDLGQHCFWYRLAAYLVPSHYHNQYSVIVNWILKNKLKWNYNQNTKLFIDENASENIVDERRPYYPGGEELKKSQWNLTK